jgi:hypothetical protein
MSSYEVFCRDLENFTAVFEANIHGALLFNSVPLAEVSTCFYLGSRADSFEVTAAWRTSYEEFCSSQIIK